MKAKYYGRECAEPQFRNGEDSLRPCIESGQTEWKTSPYFEMLSLFGQRILANFFIWVCGIRDYYGSLICHYHALTLYSFRFQRISQFQFNRVELYYRHYFPIIRIHDEMNTSKPKWLITIKCSKLVFDNPQKSALSYFNFIFVEAISFQMNFWWLGIIV